MPNLLLLTYPLNPLPKFARSYLKHKGQTLVCPLHFDRVLPTHPAHSPRPTDAQAQPAHAPAPSADSAQ